jgi:two-component system, NtrC family, response regulator AtoC
MASAPAQSFARQLAADRLNPVPPDDVLFGRTGVMEEIRLRALKACKTNIPILLCGDGGTGKEALGRWIHANSGYSTGAFVKVNCAAIPGALLESELFGYEKGAFTGAVQAKPGLAELADRGTLFLDEIGELNMNLQSKILHFLQDGRFSRIGGEVETSVDARLICATNRDLESEIARGNFRADLFYRINVVRFRMPSLRERRADIPVLAEFFREHHERQFGKPATPFPAGMVDYLQNLEWPGNVRELSNGVARFVLIGSEAAIKQDHLRTHSAPATAGAACSETVPLKHLARSAIKDLERHVILESLRAHQWNRRKTAQALKISYRSLIYKIHDAGLVSGKNSPVIGPMSSAR